MPKKARPHPKPKRRPTFIRAWRKHRDLTLEQFSDRLQTELGLELDHSQLSRIERGESPYTQDNLEAFAQVLRCEPADLLMRDPDRMTGPEAIWSVWDRVPPTQRQQAARVLETFAEPKKSTGTEG